MTSRLRRHGQVMVFQKRNLLSRNELFEMMRSRQVYYVQNELRKDLDRTLRTLKHAEKMQLAGLRIQKAIFLKRKIVLDLKKRRLKNCLAAAKNKPPIYSHLQSGNRGFVSVAVEKSDCQESSKIISRPANGIGRFPTMPNDHTAVYGRISSGPERPSGNSSEMPHFALGSTVNSEWMSSIQGKLNKLSLQDKNETDNLELPHTHRGDKSRTRKKRKQKSDDEDIQTTNRSTLKNSSSKNNEDNQNDNEISKEQERLLDARGNNNINESYIGGKQNDQNLRLFLGQEVKLVKKDTPLILDKSTVERKHFGDANESDDQNKRNTQLEELSVVQGMRVLSLNERSENLQETQSQMKQSSQKMVETNFDGIYSHWLDKTEVVPPEQDVPRKDGVLLNGHVDNKKQVILADDIQHRFAANAHSEQTQLNWTEKSAVKSDANGETNSWHINMNRNVTRKQGLLSTGVAYLDRSRYLPEKLGPPLTEQNSNNSRSSPGVESQGRSKRHASEKLKIFVADKNRNHSVSGNIHKDRSKKDVPEKLNTLMSNLDRKTSGLTPVMTFHDQSKRHTPEKLNVLLANQNRNFISPAGSLERTVTMIFVEDNSVSSQDPPKSHFDLDAWLAYNKRKRGYTQIFDDKSSAVTSDDASTMTRITPRKKTSLQNHQVRFNFPKRLNVTTSRKPGMLTFREKSTDWYLNFLKKNDRHSEGKKNLQEDINVRKYISNKRNYALLPNIATETNYKSGNSAKYGRYSRKLTLSRESTGEQLQRLKDDSKMLQEKVHDFVYS